MEESIDRNLTEDGEVEESEPKGAGRNLRESKEEAINLIVGHEFRMG